LSLAGRYCVLMPNTARGGGISRKINSAADRRRLKSVIAELDIPEGVAVIVRTAGSQRSKPEIRRDYDYLLRLWSEIRDATLSSTAPSLIYEEANLIKRAIRDLYRSDMEEILVEGEQAHKAAKAFMKSLMPSHAKNVKLYKDPAIPLFQRHQVEGQIDAMHSPTVQLKSGGYIVMNVTEALIAVDVNSGKATRERHIEETAYKTNSEAADEVARQLRLRDLAGLIVIDFIDMEESRHDRSVERRLKDALRSDRARIQIGRISAFGLLEMSRQRLRPSLVETTTGMCPTCQGTGHVRTTESAALHIMRALEENAVRHGAGEISVTVPTDVAMHLLNNMRARLVELERIHDLTIRIGTDSNLIAPNHRLERAGQAAAGREEPTSSRRGSEKVETGESDGERQRGRGRGRRRRSDGGRSEAPRESAPPAAGQADAEVKDQTEDDTAAVAASETQTDGTGEPVKRRRRRGKRGGRRRGRRDSAATTGAENADTESTEDSVDSAPDTGEAEVIAEAAAEIPSTEATESPASEDTAKKKSRSRRAGSGRRRTTAKSATAKSAKAKFTDAEAEKPDEKPADTAGTEDFEPAKEAKEKKPAARKPRRRTRKPAEKPADKPAAAQGNDDPAPALAAMPPASEPTKNTDSPASDTPPPTESGSEGEATEQTQRRGWWQRWG
jgi:ribonuclease E